MTDLAPDYADLDQAFIWNVEHTQGDYWRRETRLGAKADPDNDDEEVEYFDFAGATAIAQIRAKRKLTSPVLATIIVTLVALADAPGEEDPTVILELTEEEAKKLPIKEDLVWDVEFRFPGERPLTLIKGIWNCMGQSSELTPP